MDNEQLIKSTAKDLLSLLGVEAEISVTPAEEGADVVIEAEENGMLIGYHGETLEAIQLILSLIVAKKTGLFIRLSVEVGSYKKQRMEFLEKLVSQTREQVILEKRGISLPDLKSWERRYVHMILKEDPEVATESTGAGRERMLTIFPKQ